MIARLLLLLALFTALPAQAGPGDELLTEIRRLQGLLATPCDPVQESMEEMVRQGRNYQSLERRRQTLWRKAEQAHAQQVAQFNLKADAANKVAPGRFAVTFERLRRHAADKGLLMQARPQDAPGGYSLGDLAWVGDSAARDFSQKIFFAEKRRDAMVQVKAAEKALFAQWEAARKAYLESFGKDGPWAQAQLEVERLAGEMDGVQTAYVTARGRLGELATSGRYEHCLGEVSFAAGYTVSGPGEELKAYQRGQEGSFESLPGVGFKFWQPQRFSRFTQAKIPEEFPLWLDLKFDRKDYLRLEAERYRIKAQAEAEGVMAIGKHLIQTLSLGFADGGSSTQRMVGEGFKLFYGTTKAAAGIGDLLIGGGKLLGKGAAWNLKLFTDPVNAFDDAVTVMTKVRDGLAGLTPGKAVEGVANATLVPMMKATFTLIGGAISAVDEMHNGGDAPPSGLTEEERMFWWMDRAHNAKAIRDGLDKTYDLAGEVLVELATAGAAKGVDLAKGGVRVVRESIEQAVRAQRTSLRVELALKRAKGNLNQLAAAKRVVAVQDEVADAGRVVAEQVRKAKLGEPAKVDWGPERRRVFEPGADAPAGSFNVYDKVDDTLGARVSLKPLKVGDQAADLADQVGRQLMEDVAQGSGNLRLPQIHDKYFVLTDPRTGRRIIVDRIDEVAHAGMSYRRVEMVEHVDPALHAKQIIDARVKQGLPPLSEGMQRAVEAGMRDINSKGFVWLDNKKSNFALIPVDAALDRHVLMPLDPGGMVRITKALPGKSLEQTAQLIQQAVRKGADADGNAMSKLFHIITDMQRHLPEGQAFDFGDYLDMASIGLKSTDLPPMTLSKGVYVDTGRYAGMNSGQLGDEVNQALQQSLQGNAAYRQAQQGLEQAQKKLDTITQPGRPPTAELDEAGRKIAAALPEGQTVEGLKQQVTAASNEMLEKLGQAIEPARGNLAWDAAQARKANLALVDRPGSRPSGFNNYHPINDEIGMRVSKQELTVGGAQLDLPDRVGRELLEETAARSNTLRVPKKVDEYFVLTDPATGRRTIVDAIDPELHKGMSYKRVEVVEQIDPKYHVENLLKQGQLNAGQKRAYEAAIRDINADGKVWLDNKKSNFAIIPVDEAAGRYVVSVFDTGGPVRIRQPFPGKSPAETARIIQQAYEEAFEGGSAYAAEMAVYKLGEHTPEGVFRPGDWLDTRALGITNVDAPPPLTPMAGLRIDTGDLAKVSDSELAAQVSEGIERTLANNATYQSARKQFNATLQEVEEVGKRVEALGQQAEELAKKPTPLPTARKAPAAGVDGLGLGAAVGIDALAVESGRLGQRLACSRVREKLLGGARTQYLLDAWSECKRLLAAQPQPQPAH